MFIFFSISIEVKRFKKEQYTFNKSKANFHQ